MLDKYRDIYSNQEVNEVRNLILESYSNKLEFKEDTHQYFLDGIEYDCVSNVTHRFQKHTDFEMIARMKAKREGTDYRDILRQWNEIKNKACAMGNVNHSYGESCFNWAVGNYAGILPGDRCKLMEGTLYPTNKREEAIYQFWQDLPACFIPVLSEAKVFCTDKHYAGTFDILFWYASELDPSNTGSKPLSGLVLMDYKTNSDLYKNFSKQKLLAPFNDFLDQPFGLYTLQLSAYQIPLEQLGLPVIGRRIIWIKDDGTYEKINVSNVTERLWAAL